MDSTTDLTRAEISKKMSAHITKIPHYRLRVGDIRVFYDVTGSKVQVLAIVAKAQAQEWLERRGEKS